MSSATLTFPGAIWGEQGGHWKRQGWKLRTTPYGTPNPTAAKTPQHPKPHSRQTPEHPKPPSTPNPPAPSNHTAPKTPQHPKPHPGTIPSLICTPGMIPPPERSNESSQWDEGSQSHSGIPETFRDEEQEHWRRFPALATLRSRSEGTKRPLAIAGMAPAAAQSEWGLNSCSGKQSSRSSRSSCSSGSSRGFPNVAGTKPAWVWDSGWQPGMALEGEQSWVCQVWTLSPFLWDRPSGWSFPRFSPVPVGREEQLVVPAGIVPPLSGNPGLSCPGTQGWGSAGTTGASPSLIPSGHRHRPPEPPSGWKKGDREFPGAGSTWIPRARHVMGIGMGMESGQGWEPRMGMETGMAQGWSRGWG